MLSFIIPFKDEEETLVPLWGQIVAAAKPLKLPIEGIFVDDGSTDRSFERTKALARRDRRVTVLRHRANFGKAAALMTGFDHARGELICTIDADLQDDPGEITKLKRKLDEGFDLVSGWKRTRRDSAEKVVVSRIFNALTARLTGVKMHDFNCGFKLYRREVVEELNLYGELYRFIPVFAAKLGFRVGEVPVTHHSRRHGVSKYGLSRLLRGPIDLLTVVFLTSYGRRPAHYFGRLSLLFLLPGIVISGYIAWLRLATGSIQFRYPLLFLGVLLIIVGVQILMTGLLAELVVQRSTPERGRTYRIAEIVGKREQKMVFPSTGIDHS